MSMREHWQGVYETRAADAVSWYQETPATSLELIEATGVGSDARIIDVGAGASRLVDHLLARGFRNLGVLDLAASGLRVARERLGESAEGIEWIEGDARSYEAAEPWDLWHDRAVFHFLVSEEDRAAYRARLLAALRSDGHVIIATFGPGGPLECSGLRVARHSAEELAAFFGPELELVESREEVHTTPAGKDQEFVFARFRRKGGAHSGTLAD